MLDLISWFVSIQAIGLISTPIVFTFFRNLPGRGLPFAKPLGLILITYALWLGTSFGLTTNSRLALIVILALIGLLGAIIGYRERHSLNRHLREEWPSILLGELLFGMFFVAWAFWRAYHPDLLSTEKPMDFAFLNATYYTQHFPPEDPWFRGETLNYYYMGYLMWASLGKIAGVTTGAAYSLALALIAGMAAIGSYSIVNALIRMAGATRKTAALWAMSAPVFVCIIGNLQGVLELISIRGWATPRFWDWIQIKGLDQSTSILGWIPGDSWWWWRATRVIDTLRPDCGVSQADLACSLDYTITEFPFFSFFLGDLHPHLSSIPFFLLILAIGVDRLAAVRSPEEVTLKRRVAWYLITGLSLGAIGFVNSWDFPTSLVIVLSSIFVTGVSFHEKTFKTALRQTLTAGLILLSISVIAYLPLLVSLRMPLNGIIPVNEIASRPIHQMIIWGVFLPFLLTFVSIASLRLHRRGLNFIKFTALLGFAPLLLWTGIQVGLGLAVWPIIGRVITLLPWILLFTILGSFALTKVSGTANRAIPAGMLLSSVAVILIVGSELFFISDAFGNRMNTIFKLYYPAWILLALVSAFALYYIFDWWNKQKSIFAQIGKWTWMTMAILLLMAGLYYPFAAFVSADHPTSTAFLDAVEDPATVNPDVLQLVKWIRRDALPGAGLIEAVGPSYSEFGHIASLSGISSIIGWTGHERQWRGIPLEITARENDVHLFYTTDNPDLALSILTKYAVKYIVLGPREFEAYGFVDLSHIDSLISLSFARGDYKVYSVNSQ